MTEINKIPCWIYKSPRKNEMYLYLGKEDDFSTVPEPLLQNFGEPVFIMQLELDQHRKLAREDIHEVLKSLESRGFHLQMPPTLEPYLLSSTDGF